MQKIIIKRLSWNVFFTVYIVIMLVPKMSIFVGRTKFADQLDLQE